MPIITATTTSTEISSTPVTVTYEEASSGTVTTDILEIGDVTTTGYKFPASIGLNNQVLVANTSNNELEWQNQSGGGGGGSGFLNGLVNLGSNDNKLILRGQDGITFEGGVEFQFETKTLNTASYNLSNYDYFIEIDGSGTNIINLPASDSVTGKTYIISKGYVGGNLIINTIPADKIDGDDTFELNGLNQRTTLISSGTNRWLII